MFFLEVLMEVKIEVLKCARHATVPGYTCMMVRSGGETVVEILNPDGICIGTVSGEKVDEVWASLTGEKP